MDIKDSYLHGTVGVVKSISVNADKLSYKLADVAGTTKTVTLPLATQSANGLMSSGDKTKLDNLSSTIGNYVTLNTDQEITGTKTFTKQLKFTVAKGTAPFLVTSDTKVTNLNADLLDGFGESAFLKDRGVIKADTIETTLTNGVYYTSEFSPINGGYNYGSVLNFRSYSTLTLFYMSDGAQSKPRIWYRNKWNAQTIINTSWLEILTSNSYTNYTVGKDGTGATGTWGINITGNAATATHAASADKLKTKRKLWGLDFDGSADVSGSLTGVTSINMNGDIVINDGVNHDRYIKWLYDNTDNFGWRIGYLGSKGGDDNDLTFDSHRKHEGWASALYFKHTTLNAHFAGIVNAPTFKGNLDGTYVNKLTNYSKATAISALAATDTLNTALGKLEYKADVTYNLVKGAYDGDGTIENLTEILKVLDGIKDTETIKAIIGKYLPLTGGTLDGSLYIGKADNTDYKYLQLTRSLHGLRINNLPTGAYISFGSVNSGNDFTAEKSLLLGDSGLLYTYDLETWHTIIHSANYKSYLPFLNSTTTHATNTSVIYAPTTAGTKNLVLISNGSGAPIWTNQSTLEAGSLSMHNISTYDNLDVLGIKGFNNENGLLSSNGFPLNNTSSAIAWGKTNCKVIIAARAGLTNSEVYIKLYYLSWGDWYRLLHSGNTYISSGTITINGTSITPLTSHQSLANYVTLNTDQVVSGKKLFNNQLVIRKDVGATGASVTDQQHNLLLQVMRYSDTHSVAIGVMPTGSGVIWAKANGIGYNTLYLNPHSNGVAIGCGNMTLPALNDGYYFHIFGSTLANNSITATKFIKSGGTSSQFLKADGSVDSTSYATTSSLGKYLPLAGGTMTGNIVIPNGCFIYGVSASELFGAIIHFDGTRTVLGSVGISSTNSTHIRSKNAVVTVGSSNNADYIMLHSGNYTLYVNTTNFPGLAGVRSVTINGNYLRVNTNGTNADLTIPYATTASQLNNTSVSDPSKAASGQYLKWYSLISLSSGYAGTNYGFPVENNANGILWLGTHSGPYGWLMGFSSNGRIYARYISNNSFSTAANGGSWKKIAWTSDIPAVTDYYWANIKVSSSSNSDTNPTFATATATTQVTTPKVHSSRRLTLNATSTGVDLKFNNDNTKSVILNGTAFKPFDDANDKLTLGSASARWSTIYGVNSNFSGTVKMYTGDASLAIYSGRITDAKSDGNICFLTSIDNTDPQSHSYAATYGSRETIVLQPRGGSVYVGTNPDGNSYKFYVNGTSYLSSTLTMGGVIVTKTGSSQQGIQFGTSYLNSLSNLLLWLSPEAIRFGSTNWDWNSWAGLKYDHSVKTIYLGLADGTIFNANSGLSGGKLYLPGISDAYVGNGTYKILHANNYNSYSPTLTGTGASGTWGINISGNAATATTASNSSKLNSLSTIYNRLYYNSKSVTMSTTLTVWYIKIVLSGYALPCLFMIGGSYNNQIDRVIIETSGMSQGYILRNCNLNSGNITGVWHQSNYDSTEKKWIFWVKLRGIDNSSSHYSPSSSTTYTVYMGENNSAFTVTATTTAPSGASWTTVGGGDNSIIIKNGTLYGTASTASTANKLGTSTLGDTYQPIYLSSGTATACTSYAKAIKAITRSGTTFTYTCIDGTTGTFTLLDNNTTYYVYGKTINASYKTAYRTLTGRASGYYLAAIRCDTASVAEAPLYGSGIAFGMADTHGYLYMNYSNAYAYIGAGNVDKLNWTATLLHSSNSSVSGGGSSWGSSITVKINNTTATLTIPANPNTDTKVTLTVTTTSNTSWRPILIGSSYSDANPFAPSTVTNTVYATHLMKIKPSTGALWANSTITASGFCKSNSSDSYVLLGGGGHKAVSDFWTGTRYWANVAVSTSSSTTTTPTFAKVSISNSAYPLMTLTRSGSTNGALIAFANSNGTLGHIGMTGAANGGLYRYSADASISYLVCDANNSSVSGGGSSWGSSITVKIAGTSKTLTIPSNPNTWRPITNSYSGTATDTSLSLKGANDLYNAVIGRIPTVNNGKITIKLNGTEIGSFTMNQSSAGTINLTDTTYGLVGANGTTGLIKNGSTVTTTTGYIACPIINGVPYYWDTTLGNSGVTAGTYTPTPSTVTNSTNQSIQVPELTINASGLITKASLKNVAITGSFYIASNKTLTNSELSFITSITIAPGYTVTFPTPSSSNEGKIIFVKAAYGNQARYVSGKIAACNSICSTASTTTIDIGYHSHIFVCMDYGSGYAWVDYYCG